MAREEVFGPVLLISTYECESEAIAMASDTEYGLNDAVYSADLERALRVARCLHSGNISINNGQILDVGLPFGGVKQSG